MIKNIDKKTGILYKSWAHPSPKAVFLLIHGLGGSSSRWDFLADFFLKNSISSYAIELRGFGQTPELRGHIDSFRIYFQDIFSLREIAAREHPGKKIFVVGESMGGLIGFLFMGLNPRVFDGLVCLSPVFKSRLKLGAMAIPKILILALFKPQAMIRMPFDAAMCTRDVDCQKVLNEDSYEHRFATVKLLWNIAWGQACARFLKNRISGPVLFLLAGTLDYIADAHVAEKILLSLKTKDKEIIQYPQMYHALSIESGREKIFEDILLWLNKRI